MRTCTCVCAGTCMHACSSLRVLLQLYEAPSLCTQRAALPFFFKIYSTGVVQANKKMTRLGELLWLHCSWGLAWCYLSSCSIWSAFWRKRGQTGSRGTRRTRRVKTGRGGIKRRGDREGKWSWKDRKAAMSMRSWSSKKADEEGRKRGKEMGKGWGQQMYEVIKYKYFITVLE